MLCPQCQQGVQVTELKGGVCPYCGFPCAELERRVRAIQVLLGAFLVSTLAYGGVAAFLELVRGPLATDAARCSGQTLGIALLGGTIGVFLVGLSRERRALARASLEGYQHLVLVLTATAEVPAICGLMMYLLAGSLPGMVAFLAVSWALLIRLGLHLPRILHGITECLRTCARQ